MQNLILDPAEVFRVYTEGYRPRFRTTVHLEGLGLPMFTIRQVEMMRVDYQIKLGMAIKATPLMNVKFAVRGRPEIVAWAKEELRTFWYNAMHKVIRALWYTRAGGEPIYKPDDFGFVRFKSLREVYPTDMRVLTRKGEYAGLKIAAVDDGPVEDSKPINEPIYLFPPKGFIYVHDREFGSWVGRSEFFGAYDPWLEKIDQHGSKQNRKLWYFKASFSSGTIFHPPGTYKDVNGRDVPWRDLARESTENMMAGQTWAFPSMFDPDSGQRLWDFIPAQINGSGKDLLDYGDKLDTEITRGLDIPDDIISSVTKTGSFAGRTIPMFAFFNSQQQILRRIVADWKEQIGDPCAKINFGSDDFQVEASVDVERLMPSTPGGDPGGQMPEDQSINADGEGDEYGVAPVDDQQQFSRDRDVVKELRREGQYVLLAAHGVGSVRFDDEIKGHVQMSAQHAPAGGARGRGREYKGGQFEPKEAVPIGKKQKVKAHTGHVGEGGVQAHSAGPLYPYTMVIQGTPDKGVIYAQHGGTGKKLKAHKYDSQQEFGRAHRRAMKHAVSYKERAAERGQEDINPPDPDERDVQEIDANRVSVNGVVWDKKLWEKCKQKAAGMGGEIDLSKEEVEFLLNEGTVAMISGGPSPQDEEKLSAKQIMRRHKRLRKDLIAQGYQFKPGIGNYDGIEDSFFVFVPDAKKKDMLKLGEKYNQDSVVFSLRGENHLIYTTGPKKGQENPGNGWSWKDEANNYYTELKTNEGRIIKFSLDLDFDTLMPAQFSRVMNALVMGGYDADDVMVQFAVRHAPVRGIRIQGRFFKGGQFIPDDWYARANPDAKQQIDVATKDRWKQARDYAHQEFGGRKVHSITNMFLQKVPLDDEMFQHFNKGSEHFRGRNLANVDTLNKAHQLFPDAGTNEDQWRRYMAYVWNAKHGHVLMAPERAIRMANNPKMIKTMLDRLGKAQNDMAEQGLGVTKEFKYQAEQGNITPQITGKLLLWGILSRGVTAHYHESAFIDTVEKMEPWIQKCLDGNFTSKDQKAFEKWVGSAKIPNTDPAVPYGSPGRPASHNVNAFGKLLMKLSKKDENGRSELQRFHDDLWSGTASSQIPEQLSSRDVRRNFISRNEKVGIGNKVVSFIMLMSGRDDVLVLDRIQTRHLFHNRAMADSPSLLPNIYDGVFEETSWTEPGKAKDSGKKKTFDGIAKALDGVDGLAVYEALEDGLRPAVEKAGTTLGEFHWKTWVLASNQEVDHKSIHGLLNDAAGTEAPYTAEAGIYSREGKMSATSYNSMYVKNKDGSRSVWYPAPDGHVYDFDPKIFQANVSKEFYKHAQKRGVKLKGAGNKETEGNMPWYDRAADSDALKQEIVDVAKKYARGRVTGKDGKPLRIDHASTGSLADTA